MSRDDTRRGPSWHSERSSEVIARAAAQFIAREAGPGSLITVTRAQPMQHGERVIIFVTVFPIEQTRSALAFLERHREAFSQHLKKHAKLGPLPRIEFLVDNGETDLFEAIKGDPVVGEGPA